MSMSKISPNRIIELKKQITEECQRRRWDPGSVEKYGGTDYNFTQTPTTLDKIKSNQRSTIAKPLNTINSDVIKNTDMTKTKILDSDITKLEGFVTLLKSRDLKDATGTDCKSNCTGLCYTGCASTCKGSCEGGCAGGCSSCTGCTGCSGVCGTGCTWVCAEGCRNSCKDTCLTNCTNETGGPL